MPKIKDWKKWKEKDTKKVVKYLKEKIREIKSKGYDVRVVRLGPWNTFHILKEYKTEGWIGRSGVQKKKVKTKSGTVWYVTLVTMGTKFYEVIAWGLKRSKSL